MSKVVYQERVRFEKYEVLALVSLLMAAILVRLVLPLLGFTNANVSLEFLATGSIFLALLAGVLYYFINVRLETKVTEKSVKFRYFPNQVKEHKIKLSKIEKIREVDASLAEEFSGWNVHFHDTEAYCPGRKKGVIICLKDGKHILLGSKRPSKLRKAIKRNLKKLNSSVD